MKAFQIILFTILGLGVILRIFNVPVFDNSLIKLSGLVLAVFYLVFGFMIFNNLSFKQLMDRKTRKSISTKRYLYGIVLGLLTGCIAFAISGKFTFNPYTSNLLVQTPILLLIIATFPVISYFKTKSEFAKLTIKRIAVICGISFLVYVIPNALLVDLYLRDPALNEAYKEWLADPENPELVYKIRELQESK